MSFFRNQDRARRNTFFLAALFLMAVTMIMLSVTLVIYGMITFQSSPPPFHHWLLSAEGLFWAGLVIAIILGGSLFRYLALKGGGEKVAQMVNARPITADSTDPNERQLRNVTEEMAIASGVTMPRLYVMDHEMGINAFVAGYQPNEAVLVVTRGALEQLTRDELQGVVGHEFSHILNGDMRINIRLIALLAGILLIGQFGQVMLRGSFYRSSRSMGGGRDNRGGLIALGLALVVIGYIGLFFGRLIKSAISRQREFLADSAAVQFTRHPEGIAGALYKIGLNTQGAQLLHTSHAEDMNHLCFGETIPMSFSQYMASHPPIEARIEAIDPQLLPRLRARYGRQMREPHTSPRPAPRTPPPPTSQGDNAPPMAGFNTTSMVTAPAAAAIATTVAAASTAVSAPLSESAGKVTAANEDYARQLLAALPERFYELIHSSNGAVQLCYALILESQTAQHRQEAIAALPTTGSLKLNQEVFQYLLQTLTELGPAFRLPALELALPGLRDLEEAQSQALLSQVNGIARLNDRVSLYEFAVIGFLDKHLRKGASRKATVRYRRYQPVMEDLRTLLWLMARATTGDNSEQTLPLYQRAMAGFENPPQEPASAAISAKALHQSLQRLSQLSPMLKPAVIDACGDCALSNGRITTREYELLRIIADQLDCPMPPLPVGRG